MSEHDDEMLDEIFGLDDENDDENDEDEKDAELGIDLPAFSPSKLIEAEQLRAALHLDELRTVEGGGTLREQVSRSVEHYFELMEGEQASDLYSLVLAEVEAPLLAAVMRHTRGNQSRAAIVLGLNRGTLRTKLKQYNLL